MGLLSKSKRVFKQLFSSSPVFSPPQVTTDSAYFEQLKEVERQTFSRKRARFDYEENCSGALSLPCSKTALQRLRNDESALFRLAEDNIIEHANRRVDLFFYTLVAYYHTNALPAEGHTTLQHGKGRTLNNSINITQACHSSVLPSLIDQSIFKQGRDKVKSILSNTHFFENLNSTVELPYFVNSFDDIIETKVRAKSMDILRQVSLGKIDPVIGLNRFLGVLYAVLHELKEQESPASHVLSHPLHLQLVDLVLKGTFNTICCNETHKVNEKYIQLLLRINPDDKALWNQSYKKDRFYFKKIMELQQEILHTKKDEFIYSV